MGNLGNKWDYMKKRDAAEKAKKYFDFHFRLPIDLSELFIADAKRGRRKYAKQMVIILEQHYQIQSKE